MHAPLALEATASSVPTRNEPLLVAALVSKAFRGTAAVRDVTFELRVGEVHGLVGANGAGKSTFTRILSGAERADRGSISLGGYNLEIASPREGRRAGIAAIYQELSLVPEMSALSNVFLGQAPSRGPFLGFGAMRRKYREITEWMQLDIPARAKASSLSIADQQMIEIMRAMHARNKVLIMDEPTAPLGPHERGKLYDLIARLKRVGTGIIFVSHDLDEVLMLCDRISVMRDGELVDTRRSAEWTKRDLVAAMLGDIGAVPVAPSSVRLRADVLRVISLSVPRCVFDVSFTLGRGEVLGIAGLVGSGRTEILRALAGSEARATGKIAVDGRPLPMPSTVRSSMAAGIALVPEDRKRQGLVLSRSALANVTMPSLMRLPPLSPVNRKQQRTRGADLARSVGFDPQRLRSVAGALSGGNQQKLVIGKWLSLAPRILLLDEPTRGVDVGAKQEIYEAIRKIAGQGTAVVLVSSDLEEVVEHSDRILVLARGHAIGSLLRADATVERILKLIFDVGGGRTSD